MSTPSAVDPRTPPEPLAADLAAAWCLDPDVVYLDHGRFGARLRAVDAARRAFQEHFEREPVVALERERDASIDEAKRGVGAFLGMRTEDFGFVVNATDGMNAVLRSIRIEPGDELLTTSHVYGAVRQTLAHLAERHGAIVVEADVPFPVDGDDAIVEAVASALTPRTRLVILDHVTSPTAVRFPIERLVAHCHEHGVPVLVDGAHAPGMLDLDVSAIGADYYTANLHKWIGAPIGAAFLWVAPERAAEIHPTAISHYYGESFAREFSWQGTRDVSPWLAAPVAIREMTTLLGPDSWPTIRRYNHALATWAQEHLAAAWNVAPQTPRDGALLGSMVTLPLPDALAGAGTVEDLHLRLFTEHGVDAPIMEWGNRRLVRPSCQVYNTPDHIERLAEAVQRLAR